MKRLLLAAAAVAAMAGSAKAQEPGQPPNPDLDRDGKVTLSEFRQLSAQRTGRMFARLDANHDGRITRAEFEAAPRPEGSPAPAGPGRGGRFFERLDVNGDGVVTKAELEAGMVSRFNMADTNHDGWLSKGELIMMRQSRTRGGQ
ncbi:MAG: EF-hand domain-containing protein [Phenylobacterium sp.]